MELQNIEKTFYSEGENIGGYTFDKRKGYMKDDGRFILNKEPILIIVLHLNDIFFCRDMLVSL